ncbi:MAG: HslU--HslV peptidase proteolytic subunit, partial [Clostridia bacterium]
TLRKLEAMMIVADKDVLLIVDGQGNVVDPEHGICAIGSGGNYALSAARALANETELSAKDIAYKSLKIASEICVFTNDNIIVETVGE